MIEYQLVRSRRKSVTILIKEHGEVEVRAPLRLSKNMIDQFVESKKDWIREKLEKIRENSMLKRSFEMKPGSRLMLLGREYPVLQGERVSFDGSSFFIPDLSFEELRPMLVDLYQKIAKRYLLKRVTYFAESMEVKPVAVKIGKAETAWGSCSGKNSLNFTWKLMMAEPDVVDYVVVHELAHIREHNHSKRFWNIVSNVLPDWNVRRKKLKPLQQKLAAEAW